MQSSNRISKRVLSFKMERFYTSCWLLHICYIKMKDHNELIRNNAPLQKRFQQAQIEKYLQKTQKFIANRT